MTNLIAEAQQFLHGRILETPVEFSHPLSAIAGVPVWLKLEHLQKTGSFKLRGAFFRLSHCDTSRVLTCSAGNHGKAVAYAARELGLQAVICVPSSVDAAKLRGMRALGAEVRVSEFPGYDDTEVWALAVAQDEALPFISAFDDPYVMAGNGGTLALELLTQVPGLRTALLPVGGGGMAAGFVSTTTNVNVVACQLEASPALALSLAKGEAVTRLPAVETMAGGLEGGIGANPFSILKDHINRVALITEAEVIEAVRWTVDHHQYLIEPSAAVTIAAILTGKSGPLEGPVCVVLSGRNVALETARRCLC